MTDVRLGIDSTTPYLAIALWSPTRGTLARITERVDRAHARAWIPLIEQAFHDADVPRDAVAAVNVGVGPGSYTGTRIGIAAARGLAFGADLPLTGACTLSAMASAVLAPGDTGVVAIDARRGNVYAATFVRHVGGLDVVDPPKKRVRQDVRDAWPTATWIEDVAPDAAWIAARPPGERPATPVYL